MIFICVGGEPYLIIINIQKFILQEILVHVAVGTMLASYNIAIANSVSPG